MLHPYFFCSYCFPARPRQKEMRALAPLPVSVGPVLVSGTSCVLPGTLSRESRTGFGLPRDPWVFLTKDSNLASFHAHRTCSASPSPSVLDSSPNKAELCCAWKISRCLFFSSSSSFFFFYSHFPLPLPFIHSLLQEILRAYYESDTAEQRESGLKKTASLSACTELTAWQSSARVWISCSTLRDALGWSVAFLLLLLLLLQQSKPNGTTSHLRVLEVRDPKWISLG